VSLEKMKEAFEERNKIESLYKNDIREFGSILFTRTKHGDHISFQYKGETYHIRNNTAGRSVELEMRVEFGEYIPLNHLTIKNDSELIEALFSNMDLIIYKISELNLEIVKKAVLLKDTIGNSPVRERFCP
jgi:hypothetical protein